MMEETTYGIAGVLQDHLWISRRRAVALARRIARLYGWPMRAPDATAMAVARLHESYESDRSQWRSRERDLLLTNNDYLQQARDARSAERTWRGRAKAAEARLARIGSD